MKKIYGLIFLFVTGVSFGQVNGNSMYDETIVHEIKITFEQENFCDSLEYYYEQYLDFGAAKQYMLASVEIDGVITDSVGVREKGFFSNWGSMGNKEPLKIDFNEYVAGRKYDGLKKINLANGFSDPSLMRDALAYKFMRDAGVVAPRTSYAKVYLNDTYWGLYVVVEQVDDRFLKNWYENEDGNIFKCIDNTNLEWQGTNKISYKDEFGLRTNKVEDEWDDFIHLVDKINNESEFEDSIATALQMNNYLRVLAADVVMYNWDSYYDHGRNFYLYHDSVANAFQWIPWDYNLAFSNKETNIIIAYEDGGEADPKPLVINVLESDVYRKQYLNHLCILIDNYFSLDNLETYIDNTKDLIEEALDADPNKFFTIEEFNTSITSDITVPDGFGGTFLVPGIKSFITSRQSVVSSELSALSHTCTAVGVDEEEKSASSHLVYPNPSASGVFTIEFGNIVDQVSVYTIYGEHILTEFVQDKKYLQLDLSEYASGIYVVELSGDIKEVKRIIKQ